jgi:hypothetical protein
VKDNGVGEEPEIITERLLKRPSELEEDNTSFADEDSQEVEAEENDDLLQNVNLTESDNVIACMFKLPLRVTKNKQG